MKIYTINVNGFRGKKNIYDKSVSDEVIKSNLNKFHEFIKNIKLSEDDIIVIQEIPHQNFNKLKQPWTWENHKFYIQFKKNFSEYKIIEPIHLINSNQCTVALCQSNSKWNYIAKEKIQYSSKYDYGNKIVELEYDKKLTLLGVHMNIDDDIMWNLLLKSENKNKHTFIVGDFNAYEYRGTMSDKPCKLRKQGFISLIPSNVITNFVDKSSIDNIYVDVSQQFNSGISIEVKKTNEFITDHAICYIEFSLN